MRSPWGKRFGHGNGALLSSGSSSGSSSILGSTDWFPNQVSDVDTIARAPPAHTEADMPSKIYASNEGGEGLDTLLVVQ